MTDEERYTRITLRIPKELHARLSVSAEESMHSMNAEILKRIERGYESSGMALQRDIIDSLNSQILFYSEQLKSIQNQVAELEEKLENAKKDKKIKLIDRGTLLLELNMAKLEERTMKNALNRVHSNLNDRINKKT